MKLRTLMRKIFIIVALSGFFTLLACANNNATKESKEAKVENASKKAGVIVLTKAEFLSKVVNYETTPDKWEYLGDKPCIIDFYASWCGPCKIIAPILEELANEYSDEIYIYKVNTDQEQELAAVFGIRSLPTVLFCPMGENPQIAQGALPKEAYKEAIETVLLKK